MTLWGMNTQNIVDYTKLEVGGPTPHLAVEPPVILDRDELVAGFDGLRSNAYENHLAGRSLSELEAFYRRLMNPCEGYGKTRKQCLPWARRESIPWQVAECEDVSGHQGTDPVGTGEGTI